MPDDSQSGDFKNGSPDIEPGEEIEGLGLVRYRLRPNRYGLALSILFSWLMINGGSAALILTVVNKPPFKNDEYVQAIACSVLPTLGGLVLRQWSVNRWNLVVSVCDRGFEWRRWRRSDHYFWDDMTLVEEFRAGLPTNDYRIHFFDGGHVTLTRADLDGHRILGRMAASEAAARGIPVELC